jgi:hypothetical protein
MSLENPYRAAGAFSGKAYIRRDADAQLIEQIEDNQYYPYFAAPRQSGKSSLLLRTMAALDPTKYRVALVDLSPFVVSSYEDFWRQFLHEVARGANFDPKPIGEEDPRDVLLLWLRSCKQRLIVFMDEIDVLLSVDCREQIFSKLRTFFNLRARLDTAELQRVQFVLAGAAHSSRFIKDPRWSPFNVAIEIELEDLSPAQVSQLSVYLATAGAFAGPELTARVHELTGGSVFLAQLVFEQLWNIAARGKSRLDVVDVDGVVATIVAESPRNIHFYNIFRLVTADARLTMLFRRLTEGQELGQEEYKELRLTGVCRGASPFRNEIYARVFGPGGPLDLKVGDRQLQLTRALDAAIARRDELLGDPRAEPRALEKAEAEIRKVRRSFREGAQLQVGDVLGHGQFKLEEHIGQGGFAAVWRATDTRDGKTVAIKVLHGQFAEDKSRRDRFFRGAWKMSELQHPAIVRVLEPYGDDNGRYFFVMEYLPGGTLHDAVQELEMSGERALRLLMQVGEALHFAHSKGLVHRDVKPSNVMIDGERAKLTDFDLVRETDLTGGTRTGAMGTFIYAAPEVMSRPQDADARADIYGLGMTAVFALYGGDLAMDVIRDADRFIDHLPCNPVIQDVLKKAVAWDRNDRFATAAEFVAALERACELPVAAAGQAVFLPAGVAAREEEAVAARTSPGMLPSLAGSPAPMAGVAGKKAVAATPAGAAAPGWSPAPGGALPRAPAAPSVAGGAPPPASRAPSAAPGAPVVASGGAAGPVVAGQAPAASGPSQGPLRKASGPARSPTHGALPVVAGGSGPKRASSSGPVLSVAAKRALQALEEEDDAAEEDSFDLSVSESGVRERDEGASAGALPGALARERAVAPASAAPQGPVAPLHATISAAEMAAAALRAGSAPIGRSTTWPKEHVPKVMSEPAPAVAPHERSRAPRQRIYLVGLAVTLLLLLVGRTCLQAPTGDGGKVDPLLASRTTTEPERKTGDEAGVLALKPDPGATSAPSRPPNPTEVVPLPVDLGSAGTTSSGPETGSGEASTTATPTETAVEPRPPSVARQIDEGCRQVRFGDARHGVEQLLVAHDRAPRETLLLWCIADGYAKLGKYESALRFYNDLLEEHPLHVKALRGAAQANEYLNRRAAAAALYERLLVRAPKDPSALAFFASEAERSADDRSRP